MTTIRRDNKGTDFDYWTRRQPEIDSKRYFITSNIDNFCYVWENYKTKELMLFEIKEHKAKATPSQIELFCRLDRWLKADKLYKGYYVIIFENTTPDNGRIWVGKIESELQSFNNPKFRTWKEMTRNEFLSFLTFDNLF